MTTKTPSSVSLERVATAICDARLWVGAWQRVNETERGQFVYEAEATWQAMLQTDELARIHAKADLCEEMASALQWALLYISKRCATDQTGDANAIADRIDDIMKKYAGVEGHLLLPFTEGE